MRLFMNTERRPCPSRVPTDPRNTWPGDARLRLGPAPARRSISTPPRRGESEQYNTTPVSEPLRLGARSEYYKTCSTDGARTTRARLAPGTKEYIYSSEHALL
ncbi:hypothetical protein ACJJTC_001385 [Scirpophaga incertulas]